MRVSILQLLLLLLVLDLQKVIQPNGNSKHGRVKDSLVMAGKVVRIDGISIKWMVP